MITLRIIKFSLILSLGILVMHSCDQDNTKPRLPIAKHSFYNPKYDSCLFSIELRDSILIVSDYFARKTISDFEQIEQFLCSEIQSNNINPEWDYPIKLLIDSLTPYPIVDELIEGLELMGFQAMYFKTAINGLILMFPYKNESIQYVVAEIYGSRFSIKRSIINDCKKTSQNNSYEDNLIPPPPPPPQLVSEFLYPRLYTSDSTLNPDMCLVELLDNIFRINGKKVSNEVFNEIIYNKKVLFIKMNNSNTFNEMIKIVDTINGIEFKKYDHYSLLEYNKKYFELNGEQSLSIRKTYGIMYVMLSLAEQIYYEGFN